MYRILGELFNNKMVPGEQNIPSAVLPLLKLLTLTFIGLVLANPKMQIIPKATFKQLSKLVFVLFLPCLIFNHLGQSISVENISLWWFIPVNVLISTTIGFILGILVVIVCRTPPKFVRFAIIMTAFGNTGNLPIAIVGSVCHTAGNPFGPHCRRMGVAYVSFAQWVAVILVYTLVYHMMEPPLEHYEIVEESDLEEEQQHVESDEQQQSNAEQQNHGGPNEEQQQRVSLSTSLLVEAEWPGIEDKETEHSKTPFIARIFKSIYNISQSTLLDLEHIEEGSMNNPQSIRCLAEPRLVRKIRVVAEQTPIRHIFQPPTIASLLAIFVGLVPQIKGLVFGIDAPLSVITDSFEILAGAVVPSVMLILGGMLAEGPNDSRLGLRTTIGIIIARLLILPLLGIGVVTLAEKLNLLVTGDQMYKFVLLLQYTTPSAILLGAIASLRGYAVSESSALLFWQHLVAVFSLSFYIVIYFKLLPSF